ncbi:MAG: hypothetical protein NHG36_03815 [Chromatiaceae bacterium]|jgi:hypothetical protein|nr:hypothetical protein [Candidatus Thioaporhodococcus sediminis]
MTDAQTKHRAIYSALMASNLLMWLPAMGWWWSILTLPMGWGPDKPSG